MAKKLIHTVTNVSTVDVHRDAEWNEYFVVFRNAPADRKEATSYHTDDRQDAIDTAKHMADNPHGWN